MSADRDADESDGLIILAALAIPETRQALADSSAHLPQSGFWHSG